MPGPWPPDEFFTGLITSIMSPLLCLAFLLAGLPLIVGKRKEGLATLGSMMALLLGWNTIGSFLGLPTLSAPGPLGFLWHYRGTMVIVALALGGGILLFWISWTRNRKRQLQQRQAEDRVAELTLRAEYHAWLDDEILKLEIEALSAPNQAALSALLTRLQECRNANRQRWSEPATEAMPLEAIQREWNELRATLGVHAGELAQVG